ncbi:MAG: DNA-formamidopyrimidine glycosylase [Candidatus Zixiibacteriota bacterium]|nr:MAG: DNA-formamidopyrimidine glycosylase [candidate division Zixibacteria bacterium]
MPELPEVETVVKGLRRTVLGKTVRKVRVQAPPTSIVVSPSFGNRRFGRIIEGKTVLSVDRRGKNILISLSDEIVLWVHLKMTGHFFLPSRTQPLDKHDLVIFDFVPQATSGDRHHLRFNDYRRFGRLRLFYESELWQQEGLAELGPEPLETTPEQFIALCKSTRRMIKPALLDQAFLAGLGNIYADESLHASRIHPKRLTSSISTRKLAELHGNIQRLLKLAIRKMGTSVDSFSGINGQPGRFQKYLKVYGNEGDPCEFCGTKIIREKIGSRSSHFCPRCQRAPGY